MLLLGVDAGGSTTVAALADETGQVLGMGVAGPGNFQTWGLEAARGEVEKSIALALQNAQAKRGEIAAAYFGMAGADRPRDYELVRQLLEPIVPPRQRLLKTMPFGPLGWHQDWCGGGCDLRHWHQCGGCERPGQKAQIGGLGTLRRLRRWSLHRRAGSGRSQRI